MSGVGFDLVIATPEAVVFDGLVAQLVLRSANGDIAFLANHGPFVGEVEVCIGSVTFLNDVREQFVIDGGIVRAGGNRVIVLAVEAEFAKDIEQESLRLRQQRYEARVEDLDDVSAEGVLRGLELRGSLIG
ncbi:MAG: FoF1 ATP synthase subunit delta/epsilon [Ferrimicrobium sp.]